MTRTGIVACAVLAGMLLVVSEAMAKPQVAYLKDGRKFTGEITKTKAGYEIRVEQGGGAMVVVVAETDVLRVEDFVTPDIELQQRLAKVKPDDAEGLYKLAAWAHQNKLLTDARDLLKKVLELKPGHENAKLTLALVEAELRGPVKPPEIIKPPIVGTEATDLLTQEDIYRIRLLELKSEDRLSIEFRNKVLDRFIESMRGEGPFANPAGEREFKGLNPTAQARYIIDKTVAANAAIRDDILIKTDPKVMREFRTVIWPIINEGCGRVACHGGAEGKGKFMLLRRPMTDDRVAYTNFYILHAWEKDGRKMINRAAPDDSLLLQSGLPKDIAVQSLAHAEKVDPPVFPSRDHRNFKLVDQWIRLLAPPGVMLPPGYRVVYELPPRKPEAKPQTPTPAPTPTPALTPTPAPAPAPGI